MIPVSRKIGNNVYMTLNDVIPNIVSDDGDAYLTPTRVITIENIFLAKIIPVEEVKRISRNDDRRDREEILEHRTMGEKGVRIEEAIHGCPYHVELIIAPCQPSSKVARK